MNVELYEELSYGQDFIGEFVMYDDDPPVTPSNLSGYSAKMEFRKRLDPNETPVFTLTSNSGGGITIIPGTGQIFWNITKDQTKFIGALYTELRLTDSGGKITPAVWGKIEIKFRGTK